MPALRVQIPQVSTARAALPEELQHEQRLLGDYAAEFMVVPSRKPGSGSNVFMSSNLLGIDNIFPPGPPAKTELSERHVFLLVRDLSWEWFNILTVGLASPEGLQNAEKSPEASAAAPDGAPAFLEEINFQNYDEAERTKMEEIQALMSEQKDAKQVAKAERFFRVVASVQKLKRLSSAAAAYCEGSRKAFAAREACGAEWSDRLGLFLRVHPAGPRARGPLQLHVVDLHPAAVNTPALNASARKNLPLADAIRVLEAEAQQLFAALGGGSTRKAPARSRRRQGTRQRDHAALRADARQTGTGSCIYTRSVLDIHVVCKFTLYGQRGN